MVIWNQEEGSRDQKAKGAARINIQEKGGTPC